MVTVSKITVDSSDQVPEFIDITSKVNDEVEKSGIKMGQVLVFAQHTTAAIIIQEPEPGIHKDLHKLLHSVAPKDGNYHHASSPEHIKDQMPNGHSHCQHAILGSSEAVPVQIGKMMLGQYQRIFLVELDRARSRTVVVQIMGE